jgi:ubiquinol-cytochrome c reductase cytochrome c subunit
VTRLCRVLVTLTALLLSGGCSAYHPPPSPEPNVSSASGDIGRTIYDQTCAGCHGPAAKGTPRAPDLTRVGSAAVDFQLSTGRMPLSLGEKYRAAHQTPKLSQSDIDAVVGYLSTLQSDGPPIPQVKPGNVQLGRAVYAQNCAACHSAGGTGGVLTGGHTAPDLRQATPTQIGEAVRVGPGLMPAFPPTVLTPEQVDGLAAYVATLQDKHGDLDKGGINLGRLGPVTEGLIVIFVALPLLLIVSRRLGSRAK